MNKGYYFFSALGSVLILFLLMPVTICLASGAPTLHEVIQDKEALNAIYLSFHAGFVSGILVAIFGTPLAYILSRHKNSLSRIIISSLEIPLALPHSVAGIMVLLAYNSRAPVGSLLSKIGIVIEDSYWGIVFAMMFVSTPIFVTTVKAGFDSVNIELENVARTLGASLLKVFFKVSFPLAFRHFIAGFVLSLARSISEVGAIIIVAYYPKVAATLVIERFLGYGLSAALSLSAALALISLAVFASLRLVLKEAEK